MLTIETYSDRGMVLLGDLVKARQVVAKAAPQALMTEQRGGIVVSRKYETRIRDALARMGLDAPAPKDRTSTPQEPEPDTMPGPPGGWRDAEGKLLA